MKSSNNDIIKIAASNDLNRISQIAIASVLGEQI